MRAIKDFLINIGGGILTGCGISGFIGHAMGVGAALAINPGAIAHGRGFWWRMGVYTAFDFCKLFKTTSLFSNR